MSEVGYGLGRMNLPRSFETHASVFSSNPRSFCWEKGNQTAPVLRNRILAAKELTDMILIEWPDAMNLIHDGVYSLGRALLLAARETALQNQSLNVTLVMRSYLNRRMAPQ